MSGHGHTLACDVRADINGALLEPDDLDREHGGDAHEWARRAGIDPREIIDFSASINPLGPPPRARKAFLKSTRDVSRYPDAYGVRLKEALARRHGLEAEEVLVGNGSTQLIYLICRALRPRKALVVGPAFSEYANALKLASADVSFFPLAADSDFKFSTKKFLSEWQKNEDIAFLSTPNSVTGQMLPKAEVEEIARRSLIRKTLLVVDEAFIDFAESESVTTRVQQNPYLIVLRSLTKYYALPGLRLGFLVAHSRRVKQLVAHLEPWSVNGPAQTVALACLADGEFHSKTRRWLEKEKVFFLESLAGLKGLRPFPSAANFALVKIADPGFTALELRSFLLQRKILIRACDSFLGIGDGYFRVAVRRRKENQLLIEALDDFLRRR
jgi:threonine-phosphate decarboxylase